MSVPDCFRNAARHPISVQKLTRKDQGCHTTTRVNDAKLHGACPFALPPVSHVGFSTLMKSPDLEPHG